ncbi:MAG TPA: MerR family transcriptional regulator [bacterium]|nr:MerR family transcriptional regulator [bacterium]
MKLANCSRCGLVFAFVPGTRDICPTCIRREDEDYLKIFHYLTERPSASAPEIADATGVDIKEILRFVRENRLRLVKTGVDLQCESCGASVTQGKLCDSCVRKLTTEMKDEVGKSPKMTPKDPPKDLTRDPKYLKDRRGR